MNTGGQQRKPARAAAIAATPAEGGGAARATRDFLGGEDRHAVLVGVFEGEGNRTRWAYSCAIASHEEALQLKAAYKSLVDLAVLQIKAKIIETNPPVFDGRLESLTNVEVGAFGSSASVEKLKLVESNQLQEQHAQRKAWLVKRERRIEARRFNRRWQWQLQKQSLLHSLPMTLPEAEGDATSTSSNSTGLQPLQVCLLLTDRNGHGIRFADVLIVSDLNVAAIVPVDSPIYEVLKLVGVTVGAGVCVQVAVAGLHTVVQDTAKTTTLRRCGVPSGSVVQLSIGQETIKGIGLELGGLLGGMDKERELKTEAGGRPLMSDAEFLRLIGYADDAATLHEDNDLPEMGTEEQKVEEEEDAGQGEISQEPQLRGAFGDQTSGGQHGAGSVTIPAPAPVPSMGEEGVVAVSSESDPLAETKKCVVQLGVVDLSTNELFACGSGTIVRSDGYILTAAHVARPKGSEQRNCTILVGMWVGEGKPAEWKYEATVKSNTEALAMKTRDASTDLAVLKIESTVEAVPKFFEGLNRMVEIPPPERRGVFQESLQFLQHYVSLPPTGQWVCAFGYPMGISAHDFGLKAHRATASKSDGEQYILIDSVNLAASGASGGPLLNTAGQVVGVLSLDYNDAKGQKMIAKRGAVNLSYFRPVKYLEDSHGMPNTPDPKPHFVVKPPPQGYPAVTKEDRVREMEENLQQLKSELEDAEHKYRTEARRFLTDAQIDQGLASAKVGMSDDLGQIALLRKRVDERARGLRELKAVKDRSVWDPAVQSAGLGADESSIRAEHALVMPSKNRQAVVAANADEREAIAGEIFDLLQSAPQMALADAKREYNAEQFAAAHEAAKKLRSSGDASPEQRRRAGRLLVRCAKHLGRQHLEKNEFEEAARCFEEALREGIGRAANERKCICKLCAISLYEAGKRRREKKEWREAKRLLEKAEAKDLPERCQEKLKRYAIECDFRCTELQDRDSVEEWLKTMLSKEAAAGYAQKFRDEGYDFIEDVLSMRQSEVDDFITLKKQEEGFINIKPAHQAKILRHLAVRRWRQVLAKGRGHLRAGRYTKARECFEKLVNADLSEPVDISSLLDDDVDQACEHLKRIEALGDQPEATSFFLDQCSVYLKWNQSCSLSQSMTMCRQYAHFDGRTMLAVLDTNFPADSAKRRELLVLLQTNIQQALKIPAIISVIGERHGSYIVYFRFDRGPEETVQDTRLLERRYSEQVNDGASMLHKTARETGLKLNRQRTLELTAELGQRRPAAPRSDQIRVSSTPVVLAQIGDWKIEYTVDAELGEGATAKVFKVRVGGRPKALKVFHAENDFSQLCREATIMLRLNHSKNHPNVLTIDFVWYQQHSNRVFFLLDLVDGGTLQQWMDDGRLYRGSEEQRQKCLLTIAKQLACAIEYLHRFGVLHQDIKPTNVLMTRKGRPVLADFGAASFGEVAGAVGTGEGNDDDAEGGKCIEGRCMGLTPNYASPRVRQIWVDCRAKRDEEMRQFIESAKVSHLDDIWSFAATVLEMYAECGWRGGLSVAEAWADVEPSSLRVRLPQALLLVLRDCFCASDEDSTDQLTMKSVAEQVAAVDGIDGTPSPELQEGLEDKQCSIIHNHLGLALQRQAESEEDQRQEAFMHASHGSGENQPLPNSACIVQEHERRKVHTKAQADERQQRRDQWLAEAMVQYDSAIEYDNKSVQTIEMQANLSGDGEVLDRMCRKALQSSLQRVLGPNTLVGCRVKISSNGRLITADIIRASLWDEMTQTGLITDVGFLQMLRDQVFDGKLERKLAEEFNSMLAVTGDKALSAMALGQEKREEREEKEEEGGGEGKQEEEEEEDEAKRTATKVSIIVDKTAFAEMYEKQMLMLDSLTPHQAEKLKECLKEGEKTLSRDTHIRAPAGCGKTFLALNLILAALDGDQSAYVLFVAQNEALAIFVAKWLQRRRGNRFKDPLAKFHVLCEGEEGAGMLARFCVREHAENQTLELQPIDGICHFEYGLVVVDEAHHVFSAHPAHFADKYLILPQLPNSFAIAKQITRKPVWLLLSDVSQSTVFEQKFGAQMQQVTLSQVVRSSQRIVEGARAFQTNDDSDEPTECHHKASGPPLRPILFGQAPDDVTRSQLYAAKVVGALRYIMGQFPGLSLHDRVGIIVPDAAFIAPEGSFMKALEQGTSDVDGKHFGFTDAAQANRLLSSSASSDTAAQTQTLVLDTADNFNGLERLIVIAVGLDEVIGEETWRTRSRLYRAITRAQMMVVVVNEVLKGGWLEFLTCVDFDKEQEFDSKKERAKNVIGAARSTMKDQAGEVSESDSEDEDGQNVNQKRLVALVISNAEYEHAGKIGTALADGEAMQQILEKAGFSVTFLKDQSLEQMNAAIKAFAKEVGEEPCDSFFYFSGYGLEEDGCEYLLPIEIASPVDEVSNANAVAVTSRLNIIMLDAQLGDEANPVFGAKFSAPGSSQFLIAHATVPGAITRAMMAETATTTGDNDRAAAAAAAAADGSGGRKRFALVIDNASSAGEDFKKALGGDWHFGDENVTLISDASKEEMTTAIASFVEQVKENKPCDALFSFIGGGKKKGRRQYLFPHGYDEDSFDKELESVKKGEAVPGAVVLGEDLIMRLNGAGARHKDTLNIILLDCSRGEDFDDDGDDSESSFLPPQFIVARGSAPGTAGMWFERNEYSLFTEKFCEALKESPAKHFEDIFMRVTAQVSLESKGRQEPWYTAGGLRRRFCFYPQISSSDENKELEANLLGILFGATSRVAAETQSDDEQQQVWYDAHGLKSRFYIDPRKNQMQYGVRLSSNVWNVDLDDGVAAANKLAFNPLSGASQVPAPHVPAPRLTPGHQFIKLNTKKKCGLRHKVAGVYELNCVWAGKQSYYCEKTDGGDSCQLFYEDGYWYLGPALGKYPGGEWLALVKDTAASSSPSLSPLESGLAEAKWTDVSKGDGHKKTRAITIEPTEAPERNSDDDSDDDGDDHDGLMHDGLMR
eukprot:g321.t1